MAYGLPRKNTVKTILQGSCYKVQEPWDLAVLTRTWYQNLADIRLPFLEEITLGRPIKLTKCKTKKGLLPSAEAIKLERDYEMKRLTTLKCQERASEEIEFSLKDNKVGLRRPLPPKWQSSHNRVCTLFPVPKGDEELSHCVKMQRHECPLVDEPAHIGMVSLFLSGMTQEHVEHICVCESDVKVQRRSCCEENSYCRVVGEYGIDWKELDVDEPVFLEFEPNKT